MPEAIRELGFTLMVVLLIIGWMGIAAAAAAFAILIFRLIKIAVR